MEPFFETLVLAFIFVVVALALLGIGWLLTGKQKIKRGQCGRDPNKVQDDECGDQTSCSTCGMAPKRKGDNDE